MLCIPSQLYKWSGLTDWTCDIEEQIIPLCRFVQFTYDAFKKICLLSASTFKKPSKNTPQTCFISSWCDNVKILIEKLDCMYPKYLSYFSSILSWVSNTLSFLNDCYNKENCSLCVALFWYILIIYPKAWVCSFWILMLLCM